MKRIGVFTTLQTFATIPNSSDPTSALFYMRTDRLDRIRSHLEDVVYSIQDDLYDLRVLDIEQVTERRDDTELDHMRHLVGAEQSDW